MRCTYTYRSSTDLLQTLDTARKPLMPYNPNAFRSRLAARVLENLGEVVNGAENAE
jgi:hypothetical protein